MLVILASVGQADWVTATVTTGTKPYAVAVNPLTNKIYVADSGSADVTVIDGLTNNTTTVAAGTNPYAVAVNPVTNKIYVANNGSSNVTVIDGATNGTATVTVGTNPRAVAVNPVTNKTYVANSGSTSTTVTVIDGATNGTTSVTVGTQPCAVAVNPVTNRVYVANSGSNNVTVIAEAPDNDTKVRAAFDPSPGIWTAVGRPTLTGKGVNRSTPNRNVMMGVVNRMNTAQKAWDWAAVTSGAGTDSITWTYNWGADSLIPGENYVCAQPLESDAGITNNEGMGTPFAGNLLVYPLYRIPPDIGTDSILRPVASFLAEGSWKIPPSARVRNRGAFDQGQFNVTFTAGTFQYEDCVVFGSGCDVHGRIRFPDSRLRCVHGQVHDDDGRGPVPG